MEALSVDIERKVRTLVNTELNVTVAIELYKKGEVSLSKAAEIARMTTIEFDDILEQGFKVIHLGPDLIKESEQEKEELKDLHTGELTSILLCKREGMAFVTNDSKAKRFCTESDVE